MKKKVAKKKPVKKLKVSIVYRMDESCDMEELLINGETIAYGNEWDHHGRDMLTGIQETLDILNIPYSLTEDFEWKCPDSDYDAEENNYESPGR